MSTLVLILAIVVGIIATVLGFHWFGTDGTDWQGWLAGSLVLFEISHLIGAGLPAIDWPNRSQ